MDEITRIGARLKARRRELGWSQEHLSEVSGLSVRTVRAVENAAKNDFHWRTIVKLSQAMDVDPSEMTGKTNRVSHVGEASVLAVRNALHDPAFLPGMPSEVTGEPSTVTELWRDVERCYGAYFAGEFGVLAAELPGLLSRCRTTRAATSANDVAGPLSHTWQLAACLLVHTGKTDAAMAASERAIASAQEDSDEWRGATMFGTYAWVMLHTARYRDAEELAVKVADTITPPMSPKTDPRQLTAWGGLMMHAAVLAGGSGDRDRADEYLAAARAGAALMRADRHDYWVSFGPSQVAVQTTHIHTATESPKVALEAHRQIKADDLLPIQRARHLLNVAASLRMRRQREQAERVAVQAVRIGGQEWFRHQRFGALLVAGLEADAARPSAEMRQLRGVLGESVGSAV
jgi:transcriptional regulator with XRE-family HTH domain